MRLTLNNGSVNAFNSKKEGWWQTGTSELAIPRCLQALWRLAPQFIVMLNSYVLGVQLSTLCFSRDGFCSKRWYIMTYPKKS